MPLLTYRQRVQSVLSNLARDNRTSIDFSTLLLQLRPRRLRSHQDPYSPFCQDIRSAILDEVSAGRVVLDTNRTPSLIKVTRAGRSFFRSFQIPELTLGRRQTRKVATKSRKFTAIDEYRSLASTLRPVVHALSRHTLRDPQTISVDQIPKLIRSLLETEHLLRVENDDLSNQFNVFESPAHHFSAQHRGLDDAEEVQA